MTNRRTGATVWLGFAVGVVCVGIFVRNAPWRDVGDVLAHASIPTIVLASVFLLMTSVARAWRWRYLLRDAPVSFRHRLTSTLVGFAGNNTLPGRLGEPLRCWMLSRLDRRVGFWQAAGSLVVERLFDLTAAVGLLALFLWFPPVTRGVAAIDADLIRRLEEDATLVVGALGILAVVVVIYSRRRPGSVSRWGSLGASLVALQAGFAGLRSRRAVALSAAFTVVLWTSMVLFELLMLRAFGFSELGLAHAVGLLVVLSFAIALPQAPAGLGVVQVASETTLTVLYGMPVARAKAFAVGLWVCQVGVVVGAGVVASWVEGLSVADIRRARASIQDLEGAPSPEKAVSSRSGARDGA